MINTIYDISNELFREICDNEEISLLINNKIQYSVLDYANNTVSLSLPFNHGKKAAIHGIQFTEYEKSYKTIWNLYLASLVHTAGHAKITDISQYSTWIKTKEPKLAQSVIEYIESIKVNNYIKNKFPEYWENICKIQAYFDPIIEHERRKGIKTYAKQRFVDVFYRDIENKRNVINNEILELKDNPTHVAEQIYQKPSIIRNTRYPYMGKDKIIENSSLRDIVVETKGEFNRISETLNDVWIKESVNSAKFNKRFAELSQGLHFRHIGIGQENYSNYLKKREQYKMFLRKLTTQLKMVPNIIDVPTSSDVGFVEMQTAIQAVASENTSIQIFEQDTNRRTNEEWAILLDNSSSMRLQSSELQGLSLCLAETANELTSRNGKWGMYCFCNDFNVIKESDENYNQKIKARIGGIRPQGLSYIPDAISLATRILRKSDVERKYLFVITDGLSLGYQGVDDELSTVLRDAKRQSINVVGIGLPQLISKLFTAAIPADVMRKMISKFINTYVEIASTAL